MFILLNRWSYLESKERGEQEREEIEKDREHERERVREVKNLLNRQYNLVSIEPLRLA